MFHLNETQRKPTSPKIRFIRRLFLLHLYDLSCSITKPHSLIHYCVCMGGGGGGSQMGVKPSRVYPLVFFS